MFTSAHIKLPLISFENDFEFVNDKFNVAVEMLWFMMKPKLIFLCSFLPASSTASNAQDPSSSPQRVVAPSTPRVDLRWYPPARTQINNLTSALHAEGVYGFIYNSSTTPDEDYGVYNWCNMPHVRPSEYVQAAKEFELQYVEVLQRHHKRTPYAANSFPVESYQWNCDDVNLFLYGQSLHGNSSSLVFRQGVISPTNPFTLSGWIGTCNFPQITNAGLTDSWQHGSDLYGVYHDLLGFLPSKNDHYKSVVRYRVTNNVITSQVAGMLVNGMWSTREPFSLTVEAPGVDSLEPQYPCNTSNALFNTIMSRDNPDWKEHLDATSDLFDTLDDISGVPPDDNGFHSSFDHYYDNLSARQCHDKPLPCKLVNGQNSSTCVSQDLADSVYRLGNWEYSQIYRDNPSSLPASVASLGVWAGQLITHLRDAMSGSTQIRYYHNVAHDGSVSRLLSILQINEMVWPGMGSEVVFELYKKRLSISFAAIAEPGTVNSRHSPSGHYLRVLFGGKILNSSSPSLGRMDMVPVEAFLDYIDGLVGENASLIKSKCHS